MEVKTEKFIIEDLDKQDLRGISEACYFYNAFSTKILDRSGCTWIGTWQFVNAGKLDEDTSWSGWVSKVDHALKQYDWTKFKEECLIEQPEETKND